MSMTICFLKNISGQAQDILKMWDIGEEYQIPETHRAQYATSDDILSAILSGVFLVGNGDIYFSSLNDQLTCLRQENPIVVSGEVSQKLPVNLSSLKPYGMSKKVIDSSAQISTLTLSNKNGRTYSYSGTNPAYYDCITQSQCQIRDGVESVDTENHTVTLFRGLIENGEALMSKPVALDCEMPGEYYGEYLLWGVYVSAHNYSPDDTARMQLVDKDGIGVALGLYTQEEFDYMGGEVVWDNYDECVIEQADRLTLLKTPFAPAHIVGGLYTRFLIYPKDVANTNLFIWADPLIEVPTP